MKALLDILPDSGIFYRANLVPNPTNNLYVAELVRALGCQSFLEIGTAKGGGLLLPAAFGCRVVSVDNLAGDPRSSEAARADCLHNIEAAGVRDRVKLITVDSAVYLPSLAARSFDHVHVDGDHSEGAVLRDLRQAVRIARKVVTAHDVDNPGCPGARRAFLEAAAGFNFGILPHILADRGLGIIFPAG